MPYLQRFSCICITWFGFRWQNSLSAGHHCGDDLVDSSPNCTHVGSIQQPFDTANLFNTYLRHFRPPGTNICFQLIPYRFWCFRNRISSQTVSKFVTRNLPVRHGKPYRHRSVHFDRILLCFNVKHYSLLILWTFIILFEILFFKDDIASCDLLSLQLSTDVCCKSPEQMILAMLIFAVLYD